MPRGRGIVQEKRDLGKEKFSKEGELSRERVGEDLGKEKDEVDEFCSEKKRDSDHGFVLGIIWV